MEKKLMTFSRGLAIDPKPSVQPPETYRYGKNGVLREGQHTYENGFVLQDIELTYKFVGSISMENITAFFTTDNTNSTIEIVREVEGRIEKTVVFDDTEREDKLGLDQRYPVYGELTYNQNAELVVAFHAENIRPMWYNCTLANVTAISDMHLQLSAKAPSIVMELQTGGNAGPGSYFAAVKLAQEDGSMTQTLNIEGPIIIGRDERGKAIGINVSGIDERFDTAIVSIIRKTEDAGISVMELNPVTVTGGQASAYFDGNTTAVTGSLEEVVTTPVYYKRVGHMTVVEDYLYLGSVEEEREEILQQYATMPTVFWRSTPNTGPGTPTFMHEEVVALYIVYTKNTGTKSRAYTIPGRTLNNNELQDNTIIPSLKNYMVNPIPGSFNATERKGTMCGWQNDNELYPDTDEFGTASVPGALDLRNQKVRHHRFPSIRWCKQNLYSTNQEYATAWLDSLSLEIENITLPPGWDGYEIYYAKRSPGNAMVQGVTMLQMHGARAGASNGFVSNGANWETVFSNDPFNPGRSYLNFREARFLPFDALAAKTTLADLFVSFHVGITITDVRNNKIEDGAITPGQKNGPIVILLDSINSTKIVNAPPEIVKELSGVRYIQNGTVSGKWNNRKQETAIVGTFSSNVQGIPRVLLQCKPQQDFVPDSQIPATETSYLVSLIAKKKNVYNSFAGQQLVKAFTGSAPAAIGIEGDSFVSDYTYHAYGFVNADGGGYDNGKHGIVVVRRFITETVANLTKRFEIPGNVHSKFYPTSILIPNAAENYTNLMDRTVDPNQFGYDPIYNAVNDFQQREIFSRLSTAVYNHAFRVHRTGIQSRTGKSRSWRTLAPLDFFEMPKNHGVITNLQGFGDQLIIHTKAAMYITLNNTVLKMDNLSVALGTGDIFRVPPKEVLKDRHGMMGLQHKQAAIMSPIGYVFYDHEMGAFYAYAGEAKNISLMMEGFFRELPDVFEDNPAMGAGIHLGYDPRHKRILVTWKFPQRKPVEALPEDLSELAIGSLVKIEGRLFRFKGENTSSYECDDPVVCPPAIPTPQGDITLVGSVTGPFTLDRPATSITVLPAGIMAIIQHSPTAFSLQRLVESAGTYTIHITTTAVCGTKYTKTYNVIADISTPPCVPLIAPTVLPGTSRILGADTPPGESIATIMFEQPAPIPVITENGNPSTKLAAFTGGNNVTVVTNEVLTVGVHVVRLTFSNACSTVFVEFTITVSNVEVVPTMHFIYVVPGEGPDCPDLSSGMVPASIAYTDGAMEEGKILYSDELLTTIYISSTRVMDSSNGNLYSVGAGGVLSLLQSSCPM